MKAVLVIPKKFKLAGSHINVVIGGTGIASGTWDAARNQINIAEGLSDEVKAEVFFHELAEAINTKFVNEIGDGQELDHRVIDGYGRGLFNFLVDNASEILRVNRERASGKGRS